MKTSSLLVTILALGTISAFAAGSPQAEVTAAAQKLADQGNYSWKTTVTVPESSRMRPGPTEGKTDKGLSHVTISFGENKMEMVVKGDKGAVLQEGEWKSASEMEDAQGAGRWLASMTRNFQLPAAQAIEIAGWTTGLEKEGQVYAGKLTESGVKNLLSFRRRTGGEPPAVADASGTVQFWVKDGVLTKYQYFVKGTMTRNNNDVQVERTTIVEIKDAGKTKVEAPEAATKKLT